MTGIAGGDGCKPPIDRLLAGLPPLLQLIPTMRFPFAVAQSGRAVAGSIAHPSVGFGGILTSSTDKPECRLSARSRDLRGDARQRERCAGSGPRRPKRGRQQSTRSGRSRQPPTSDADAPCPDIRLPSCLATKRRVVGCAVLWAAAFASVGRDLWAEQPSGGD